MVMEVNKKIEIRGIDGDKVTYQVEGNRKLHTSTIKKFKGLGDDIVYFMKSNKLYIFNKDSRIVFRLEYQRKIPKR